MNAVMYKYVLWPLLGTFRISFLKCYTYFVILLCKNITILIIFSMLCINCLARYEANECSNIYE